MKPSLRAALALLAATVFPVGGAQAAQTVPENLSITLEIVEACTATVDNINFGTQGTLAAAVTAEGSVTVTCPATVAYSIALSAGLGDGATVTTRKMTGPDDVTINYSLYSNAGHSTVWGDEYNVNRVTGTGNGNPQEHTIYARVPIQSTPEPGVYSDTVTVIVHY